METGRKETVTKASLCAATCILIGSTSNTSAAWCLVERDVVAVDVIIRTDEMMSHGT